MNNKLFFDKSCQLVSKEINQQWITGDNNAKMLEIHFNHINASNIDSYGCRVVLEKPNGERSHNIYVTPLTAGHFVLPAITSWVTEYPGELKVTVRLTRKETRTDHNGDDYVVTVNEGYGLATINIGEGVTVLEDTATITETQYENLLYGRDSEIQTVTTLNQRLTELDKENGRLDTIEAKDNEQDNRLSALENVDIEYGTAIQDLQTNVNTVSGIISGHGAVLVDLQGKVNQNIEDIDEVKDYGNRIDTLEVIGDDHSVRIESVETDVKTTFNNIDLTDLTTEGKIYFERVNGDKVLVDLPLEFIIKSGYIDENDDLVLVLDNDETIVIHLEDIMAKIDSNYNELAGDVYTLYQNDNDFELRISALEVEVGEHGDTLVDHESRIGTLENDNASNKQEIADINERLESTFTEEEKQKLADMPTPSEILTSKLAIMDETYLVDTDLHLTTKRWVVSYLEGITGVDLSGLIDVDTFETFKNNVMTIIDKLDEPTIVDMELSEPITYIEDAILDAPNEIQVINGNSLPIISDEDLEIASYSLDDVSNEVYYENNQPYITIRVDYVDDVLTVLETPITRLAKTEGIADVVNPTIKDSNDHTLSLNGTYRKWDKAVNRNGVWWDVVNSVKVNLWEEDIYQSIQENDLFYRFQIREYRGIIKPNVGMVNGFYFSSSHSIDKRQVYVDSLSSIYVTVERELIDNQSGTTLEDKFKTYLQENNIQGVFQLAQPTEKLSNVISKDDLDFSQYNTIFLESDTIALPQVHAKVAMDVAGQVKMLNKETKTHVHLIDSLKEVTDNHTTEITTLNTENTNRKGEITKLQVDIKGMLVDVEYNQTTGELTFLPFDEYTPPVVIDLPLELIVESGTFNETNDSIVLTLANGQTLTIPIGKLLTEVENRLNTLETRLGKQVNGTLKRIDDIDTEITNAKTQLNINETAIATLETNVTGIESRTSSLESGVSNLNTQMSGVNTTIGEMLQTDTNHETRIINLENNQPTEQQKQNWDKKLELNFNYNASRIDYKIGTLLPVYATTNIPLGGLRSNIKANSAGDGFVTDEDVAGRTSLVGTWSCVGKIGDNYYLFQRMD